MRRLLEIVWQGGTGRSVRVLLGVSSGEIGARLPEHGTWGTLVTATNASLIFHEPDATRLVFTNAGMNSVVTASGTSTVIAAQDVAALNVHFGRMQPRPTARFRVRACIFEVTLSGDDERAEFACLEVDGYVSAFDRVRYFVRQLQKQRAKDGLPEIEVTKTIDTDCLRRAPLSAVSHRRNL